MTIIIIISIVTFLFYYLASFNSIDIKFKWVIIFFFFIFSVILRHLINPELNKDYYGYFEFRNFFEPTDFLSFLFTEPYLYLVYKFFTFFTDDLTSIFKGIYWFNFFITNIFFIWLLTRKDIAIWKKSLLFTFYYFLFAFVLLRNAPVYMLFACFFYYSYRNIKFRSIFLTPFMHISSLAMMVTVFHKRKHYLFILGIILIIVPIMLLIIFPFLSDVIAFQKSLSKVEAYSETGEIVSVFHKIFLLFVTLIVLITFKIYKKKAFNPILLTAIGFYYIFFYLNPVVGFRFTPYVFFAILLFKFDGSYNKQIVRILNIAVLLLIPYFLFTLFDTHYL